MIEEERKKYKKIYDGKGIFGYNKKEAIKQRKKYGHGNKVDENMSYVKNISPLSIVDIGCGHNEFIQKCRNILNIKSKGVDFACPNADVNACASSLPFEDKEYDLLTSYDMLEHVPEENLHEVFQEFSRISKRFIFIICTSHSSITIDEEILHVCNRKPMWWTEKIVKFGSKINDISYKKNKLFIYGEWSENLKT